MRLLVDATPPGVRAAKSLSALVVKESRDLALGIAPQGRSFEAAVSSPPA